MTDLRETVREKYAEIARGVQEGTRGDGCCGPAACGCGDPITSNLYAPDQTASLPAPAVSASLGCGNPTALITLEEGQTVLDLGSGGGIDALLAARRVGPRGRVYGVDMTGEMLALARANAAAAGLDNVTFLEGTIEALPLPDRSVDVVISNCVINLSTDKARVLREAFRVLRPGGRFAVSDVVVRGDVPDAIRRSMELWIGCVAGALEEGEYGRLLRDAGFVGVEIEPWRIYDAADAREFLRAEGLDAGSIAPLVEGRFASAFVRAVRPV